MSKTKGFLLAAGIVRDFFSTLPPQCKTQQPQQKSPHGRQGMFRLCLNNVIKRYIYSIPAEKMFLSLPAILRGDYCQTTNAQGVADLATIVAKRADIVAQGADTQVCPYAITVAKPIIGATAFVITQMNIVETDNYPSLRRTQNMNSNNSTQGGSL